MLARDITTIEAQTGEALAAILASIPVGVRVVRVANPLRGPLTLQRVVIQAGQLDPALAPETALAETIGARRSDDEAVLLVIEQAESLADDVLPALQSVIEAQRRAGPSLHVLLVRGSAAARDEAPVPAAAPPLAEPALEPLPEAAEPARIDQPPVVTPPPMSGPSSPALLQAGPAPDSLQAVAVLRRRPPHPARKKKQPRILWAIVALLILVLAVTAYSFRAQLR